MSIICFLAYRTITQKPLEFFLQNKDIFKEHDETSGSNKSEVTTKRTFLPLEQMLICIDISWYTKNVLNNQFKTWDILVDELAKFQSDYNVSLVGDFNARTGSLPDFIYNDDQRYLDLPDDYIPDIELISRQNCDVIVNQFGEKLLELCKMCGMRIINGRLVGF